MRLNYFLNLKFTQLDSIKSRLFLVVFFLVYSVLFLNFFVPFNMNNWMPNSGYSQFIYLSSYGIIGALGIAFSQFFLRKWLKREQLLFNQFLIWVLLELFFLTILLTVIFGDINSFSQLFSELIFTLKHTFLIAVIPYSIVLLILTLIKYKSELAQLKNQNKKVILSSETINFTNEKGTIKLTMLLSDLIYIESTDNYVYIYYHSQNKIKKELLRNSLKNLENDFKNSPIKRCHRSYMVNLESLNLVKRTGQKIDIKLNHLSNLIPVSKSYHQEFKKYL